ncbi:MAG: RNA methyltransferase [Paramuribaculum sp.]|nr:RNA methyltransferase [Paramuribaculum sp.]MDE6304898.1 RNA methyltransferase [Paramuribaculum sp.]
MVADLDSARHRRDLGLWKAEGTKCVLDLTAGFRPEILFATAAWLELHPHIKAREIITVAARDMGRLSRLSSPPEVIALFSLPCFEPHIPSDNELVVALDTVQDPGNLGTIIRTCDWFGVRHIVCSPDTVDAFSPKVVMATMGALARVEVSYTPLAEWLEAASARGVNIYGTFLNGDNIYDIRFLESGSVVVMGNEGKGISSQVEQIITRRIHIPSYPIGQTTSESLNVATATAITLSEMRRRALTSE